MKFKKVLAVAMAAAMTLGLAACGSSSEDGGEGGSSGGEEKTLVYWSMWQETEPQADILKTAIENYEAANPNVTVEVEWQGRGVKDLISAAVAAGEHVDIFDSDPINIYKTDPSIMMDMTEFYDSESLDGSGKISDTIMAGLLEWDQGMSEDYSDGNYHSVPYNPYCMDFFYNKDHFEAAGIEKVPEPWEELDAACAALKAAGYEPIVTDDAYAEMVFAYYLERLVGEDAVKEMNASNSFENEAVLTALQAMEDFAQKGYFAESCATNKYPAGQQQFARQEASMYFNASFMASENAETAGDDFPYGHFAYPTVPGGEGVITENTVGGQAFMVNANTENKEEAYELLRYFVGQDCQDDFLENGLTPNLADMDWPSALSEEQPIVSSVTRIINWGAGLDTGELGVSVVKPHAINVIFGTESAADAYQAILDAGQ